jgi:hypothetical protein
MTDLEKATTYAKMYLRQHGTITVHTDYVSVTAENDMGNYGKRYKVYQNGLLEEQNIRNSNKIERCWLPPSDFWSKHNDEGDETVYETDTQLLELTKKYKNKIVGDGSGNPYRIDSVIRRKESDNSFTYVGIMMIRKNVARRIYLHPNIKNKQIYIIR